MRTLSREARRDFPRSDALGPCLRYPPRLLLFWRGVFLHGVARCILGGTLNA